MHAGGSLTFERPDQLFKGQVLVGVCRQCGRTDALQYFPTRRVTAEVCPQNYRIDKKPDQPSVSAPRPIGDKGGHTNGLLALCSCTGVF